MRKPWPASSRAWRPAAPDREPDVAAPRLPVDAPRSIRAPAGVPAARRFGMLVAPDARHAGPAHRPAGHDPADASPDGRPGEHPWPGTGGLGRGRDPRLHLDHRLLV